MVTVAAAAVVATAEMRCRNAPAAKSTVATKPAAAEAAIGSAESSKAAIATVESTNAAIGSKTTAAGKSRLPAKSAATRKPAAPAIPGVADSGSCVAAAGEPAAPTEACMTTDSGPCVAAVSKSAAPADAHVAADSGPCVAPIVRKACCVSEATAGNLMAPKAVVPCC